MGNLFLNSVELQILAKVAIAMLLGALIGVEREIAHKPAGLRTHMLVAGAAALLVALGGIILDQFVIRIGETVVRTDPIRIIAAVITGVTFLGAGTIIRERDGTDVEGLTTAASILFASAVGMSVALEKWVLAVGSAILVLIILRLIPFLLHISRRG